MLSQLKHSWALFLASAMVMAGYGLNTSHLGIRGSLEGFSPTELGFVFSVYALGFLVSTRITPHLLRRVGHVRVYAAYVAGASVCALLYLIYLNPVLWGLFRFCSGLCMSGIFVVSESWLNGVCTRKDRGRMLSLYVMTQLIGLVCGQVLLQAGSPAGPALFVLASALVSLSCVPLLLSMGVAPVHKASRRLSIPELFRASPLGTVGICLMGMAFSVTYTLGAVFGVAIGMDVGQVALFVAAIYIGGTLFQYPVGWLSDRLDRRKVVMGMSLVAVAVTFTAWYVAPDSLMVVPFGLLIGASFSPMYPLLNAHANDFVAAETMPSVSAGLMFLQGIGSTIGPVLAGFVMVLLGPYSYFLVLSFIAMMILIYAAIRSQARPATPGGEGGAFTPLPPKATQVAAEIYGEEARERDPEKRNDTE